jgi:LysR family transcriptional activator of nhaA
MNLHHLYYFWAAAKSGGIMRASEQLHTTPQTLSGQIKLLEGQLGCALFRKVGRRLELTQEGTLAMGYAEQIFVLSQELESTLKSRRGANRPLDFRVGIADSVPKSIAYRLLEPALGLPGAVRLLCHEGDFRSLLAQMAVQRLDLVIADEPMDRNLSVKGFNHALGRTAMSFFATPALRRSIKGNFPACLDGAPMLLQGASSAMRRRLDVWLARNALRPRAVGEFDDAALLRAFGGEGRGVFMAPSVLEQETCSQHGVLVLGRTTELVEEFYAVSAQRRVTHPCVVAITEAARTELFSAASD